MIAKLLLLAVAAQAGTVAPLEGVLSRPVLNPMAAVTGISAVSLPVLPSAFGSTPFAAVSAFTPAPLPSLPVAVAVVAPVSVAPARVVPATAKIPGMPVHFSAHAGDDGSGFFDGAAEHEEQFAERREQKREEIKHAHAERPAFDFVRGRFDPGLAKELAETTVSRPGGKPTNGYRLLALLVTPLAAHPDSPPDPTRLDAAQFGRSDGEIRALLEKEGIPRYAMDAILDKAFRWGLVYRIHDSAREKTFYGLTQEARDLLNLKQPRAKKENKAKSGGKTAAPKASALGQSLIVLAEDAVSWPKNDEMFEFAAQTAYAAASAGLIKKEALPEAFRTRADAIGFEAERLNHSLLTLLESAEDGPQYARILALCEAAVAEGALSRAELDEVLR